MLGEADPMNVYVDANEICSAAGNSKLYSNPEVITENGVDFVRLYGNGTATEAYLQLYSGGTKPTGKYIVYKYRIPTTNTTQIDSFEFWTSTERTGAGGSDNILVGGSTIRRDGNWHVMVIDVTQLKQTKMTFAPAENGTYTANYLRVDTWNKAVDTLSYVDVAYLGMSDSLSEIIEANSDIEYISLLTSKTDFTNITTAPEKPENATVFSLESALTCQAQEINLTLSLHDNTGISYIKLLPEYDSNIFTLKHIQAGSCFEQVTAADGYLIFNAGSENISIDGTLATLTFAVNENAKIGEHSISIAVADLTNTSAEEIVFSAENATITVIECKYGDCNGDGAINILDILLLREYLSNYDYAKGLPCVDILRSADANGDGSINSLDLMILRKYLAYYNYETDTPGITLGKQ